MTMNKSVEHLYMPQETATDFSYAGLQVDTSTVLDCLQTSTSRWIMNGRLLEIMW